MKGVSAVVTIGADALWTELAELSAVADARIHVPLDIAVSGARGAVHGPNERKNGVKAFHELVGGGVSMLNSKSEIGNLKSATGSQAVTKKQIPRGPHA